MSPYLTNSGNKWYVVLCKFALQEKESTRDGVKVLSCRRQAAKVSSVFVQTMLLAVMWLANEAYLEVLQVGQMCGDVDEMLVGGVLN